LFTGFKKAKPNIPCWFAPLMLSLCSAIQLLLPTTTVSESKPRKVCPINRHFPTVNDSP
jgi:hypothetical protein